jgi:hypothetical protein
LLVLFSDPLEVPALASFLCYNKISRKTLKEKRFILVVVSEVSVHGQLAPLLWACGKGETTWWKSRAEESCSPHLKAARKQRDRKGPGTRYTLPGHTQVIHFLQPGST